MIKIMKNLFICILVVFMTAGCEKNYELGTAFNVPSTLNSPNKVVIDVTSSEHIDLTWEGGGAEDGSYVLYEIQFYKKGGNMNEPVDVIQSDLGALPKLTITHAILNAVARKAGIAPGESGVVSWTVISSKAGVVKASEVFRDIEIVRGEGIDNMPQSLYLHGEANESQGATGSLFRKAKDGVYVIYTKISGTGVVSLKGQSDGESYDYMIEGGKLKEGVGSLNLTPNINPYRITVDFNTLSVKSEIISNVRCIWGATYEVIGNLEYIGEGKFSAPNRLIQFIDPSNPATNPPSWLSWIEERYYFIASIDGVDKCWGRNDGISPERPTGGEALSFYEIGEYNWSQWDHLWKMSGSLNMKRATISINTNKENLMVHEFTNITNP
jgi:hypothetical protein